MIVQPVRDEHRTTGSERERGGCGKRGKHLIRRSGGRGERRELLIGSHPVSRPNG